MHKTITDILKTSHDELFGLVEGQAKLNGEIDVFAVQLLLAFSCIGSGRNKLKYNTIIKRIHKDINLRLTCKVCDAVLNRDDKQLILTFDDRRGASYSGKQKNLGKCLNYCKTMMPLYSKLSMKSSCPSKI